MCSLHGKVCYGKVIKITDNSVINTLCNSYHEALLDSLEPLGDSIEPCQPLTMIRVKSSLT